MGRAHDNGHSSGLTGKALTSLIWVVGGAMSQTVIKLVVLAVLARILTPAEFGLIALSMMLGTLILMVCRIGFGPALVQLPQLSQAHITAAMTLAIPISALAAGGMVLAAPQIAAFFDQPDLVPLLYLNALIPFMLGIAQVPESLLQRDLKFKTLTLLDGFSFMFGYGAVSIAMALMGFGAISVIYGLVAQDALRTILLFSIRFVRPGRGFGLSDVRGLLRFGFGLSLVQATNMAAYQLDNLVVSKMLGTQALGFYSRAYQVITVPTKLIGNSLIKALFPAMSLIQSDTERFERGFARALGGSAVISVPASVFLFIFAPEIILVMLGDQWGQAVLPFQILSLAILFRVGHKVCEAAIRAKGAVYRLWTRQAFFALSVLAFAYIGQSAGIAGVAFGVLFACALNFAVLLVLTRQLIGVRVAPVGLTILRQVGLGVPFAALLWGAAELMRTAAFGPLAILIPAGLLAVLAFGVPLLRLPGLFGPECVYISNLIRARLSRKVKAPIKTNVPPKDNKEKEGQI